MLTEQPVTLHTDRDRQGLRIPAADVLGGVSPTGTAQASDTRGGVKHDGNT